MLDKFKVILWDFDGVLMDSNSVRDMGFKTVLANYPAEQVQALMTYHKANGGLSRYVKFRYFFEEIRNEEVLDEQIQELAKNFSIIMQKQLFDKSLLIQDSIQFVKDNFTKFKMHIVSGSDGVELNILCKYLNIYKYFKTINGSPTTKNELVKQLLTSFNYELNECVLIGDSINDMEAASVNNISFAAYNNSSLFLPENININQFHE